MVFVGVDRTGADETHQVEMAFVFFDMLDAFQQDGILEEAAILDGERNTGHVLIDDPAGAHGHMTHFAVTGGVPRQAYGNPRGLEGGHGVETVELVKGGESRLPDRVPLDAIGQSPAIEYDEYERFVHFVVYIGFVFQSCAYRILSFFSF